MAEELKKVEGQGTQDGNKGNSEQVSGFQKAMDHIQRGYDKFRCSKPGRWMIRIAKGAAIVAVAKFSYDKGKESVKPTVVLATPIEPEEAKPEETTEPEETRTVEEEVKPAE